MRVLAASIRPRKHPPASRTLRLAKAPVPLASTLLPLRQDVRHVLLHGRRRRSRRPDPRARFPEDHRLRDGRARVAPARVSVRARASSVMGARVVTARYVRQSRRNLRNASSRAVDRAALASLAPRRRARSRRPPYPLDGSKKPTRHRRAFAPVVTPPHPCRARSFSVRFFFLRVVKTNRRRAFPHRIITVSSPTAPARPPRARLRAL